MVGVDSWKHFCTFFDRKFLCLLVRRHTIHHGSHRRGLSLHSRNFCDLPWCEVCFEWIRVIWCWSLFTRPMQCTIWVFRLTFSLVNPSHEQAFIQRWHLSTPCEGFGKGMKAFFPPLQQDHGQTMVDHGLTMVDHGH